MKKHNQDIAVSLPRFLYRYQGLKQIDRMINVIENDGKPSVYLASPSKFNDPYDSYLPDVLNISKEVRREIENKIFYHYWVDIDKVLKSLPNKVSKLNKFREENIDLSWNNWIKKFSKFLSKEEIGDVSDKEEWEVRIYDERRNILNRMKKMITNGIGITSFSASRNNILMWSHYADMHRGICLIYDTNIIREMASVSDSKLLKVKYGGQKISYIDLIMNNCATMDSYSKYWNVNVLYEISTQKKKCWSYEKEWRMVKILGEDHNSEFDGERFVYMPSKKILTGINMPSDYARKVNWLGHKLKIPVEKVKL